MRDIVSDPTPSPRKYRFSQRRRDMSMEEISDITEVLDRRSMDKLHQTRCVEQVFD
jgi:hypothetical protein